MTSMPRANRSEWIYRVKPLITDCSHISMLLDGGCVGVGEARPVYTALSLSRELTTREG